MKNLKTITNNLGSLQFPSIRESISEAERMLLEGEDVCIMSAEELDTEPASRIKSATIESIAIGGNKNIPVSGLKFLKNDITEKFIDLNRFYTTPEQIVITTGARLGIFETVCTLCGADDEVILPAPYWHIYTEIIKASGAKVKIIESSPENNFILQPDKLKAAITEKTKLIILNNPVNPTGTVYDCDHLTEIAEIAVSENIMVLADETYEKWIFNPDTPHISIASLSPEINELTITVNSFDISYAMAGWRIGYLSAPQWLADRISALQNCTTSNPNSFVQYGAHMAVRAGKDHIKKTHLNLSQRRELLCALLSDIKGLKFFKPDGAFYIFCDISNFGISSGEFCTELMNKYKVSVLPGNLFGAEGFIRLSYTRSDEVIRKAARRLRSFCKKL